MFIKNDKWLIIASVLVDVVALITIFAGVVLGIIMLASGDFYGLYFILVGLIATPILWIFERLTLSLFCDVKLIRNNLYDNSNDYLDSFIKKADENKQSQQDIDDEQESRSFAESLRELKQLVDEGVISQEEFETQKKRILENR